MTFPTRADRRDEVVGLPKDGSGEVQVDEYTVVLIVESRCTGGRSITMLLQQSRMCRVAGTDAAQAV